MTDFDLIGTLRTYSTTQGWIFLSGAEFYQNYELTRKALDEGIGSNKYIFGARFSAKPTFKNGVIISIRYDGSLMLGQKAEPEGTYSSLDETFIQKYDNRLLDLMTLLATTIESIACANELDVSNVNFDMIVNRFDENIDGVECSITFIQGQ